MTKLFLLGDVAKMMKKRPHQITYAITSGLLPEPEMRIGGKRIFQEQDVQRVATISASGSERRHHVRLLEFDRVGGDLRGHEEQGRPMVGEPWPADDTGEEAEQDGFRRGVC